MKKSFFHLAICSAVTLFICSCLIAQTDSEKQEYWKALQSARHDTSKVFALLDYGGLFEYTNYDSAEYYYREALRLSEKYGFIRGIQRYISYQSVIFNLKGQFDSSLHLCRRGIEIADKYQDNRFLGTHYNNIGNIYQYKGNNDSAAWYYLKGSRYFEIVKDSMRLGILYSNLAGVFTNLRQYRQSLYYNFRALDLAEATGDKAGVGYALNNAGAAYKKLSMNDSASFNLLKALPVAKATGDLNLEKDILVNLGFVELNEDNYHRASQYFNLALAISNRLQNDYGIVFCYKGLASVYIKEGRFGKAKLLINKAIGIAAGKNEFMEELQNLYLLRYEAAMGLGDHTTALAAYRNHIQIRDSIMNVEVQNNVATLEKQYQAEKKEKLLLQKDLQISRQTILLRTQNNWIIVLSVVMILLGAIVFLLWKYFKQKRLADLKQQEFINAEHAMQAREEERNRIARELHDDLGATLSGIVMHTHLVNQQLKNKQVAGIEGIMARMHGSATEMISKLSDIVWLVNPGHDSMDDLIQRIEEFAVDMARSQDMDVEIDTGNATDAIKLDMQTRKNIYLICKEAINNAVKYSSGSKLQVKMLKADSKLSLLVRDNGKGFNVVKVMRGNGLRNMKERADAIGAEYAISSDEAEGTKVSIECRIPQ